MRSNQDIDYILRKWTFQPGVVSARLVRARDGREVLQMRIEMGLMQMETENRPDGDRPGGADTYLAYMVQQSLGQSEHFTLSEEQCAEMDREFLQYYHRRICWLALREFERAVEDADHTLDLMDFVAHHSPDQEWTLSHEQYRPFVLFHRTQAAALGQLEKGGPEAAIEEVGHGLTQIRKVFQSVEGEEDFEQDPLVRQLIDLQQWIREHYQIGRTLVEQLTDAIAAEQYELAAKLRDEIAQRQTGK
jgi:hypothetical protein